MALIACSTPCSSWTSAFSLPPTRSQPPTPSGSGPGLRTNSFTKLQPPSHPMKRQISSRMLASGTPQMDSPLRRHEPAQDQYGRSGG
eukprot:1146055-Rhodomonas_salina.1